MCIFTVFLCDRTVQKALDTCPHTQTKPQQRPCVRQQKDKVHLLNLFNNGQWKNMMDYFYLRLHLKYEGYRYKHTHTQF